MKQRFADLDLARMDQGLAVEAEVGADARVALEPVGLAELEAGRVDGVEPGGARDEHDAAHRVELGQPAGHEPRARLAREVPRPVEEGRRPRDGAGQRLEADDGRDGLDQEVEADAARRTPARPLEARDLRVEARRPPPHRRAWAGATRPGPPEPRRRDPRRAPGSPAALTRTMRSRGPKSTRRSAATTHSRACAFWAGGTASSRSRMTPSAAIAAALAMRSGRVPGTKRRPRRSRLMPRPGGARAPRSRPSAGPRRWGGCRTARAAR